MKSNFLSLCALLCFVVPMFGQPTQPPLVGGIRDHDANAPEIKDYASRAVQLIKTNEKIDLKKNQELQHKIESAKTQVVAGQRYVIILLVEVVNCDGTPKVCANAGQGSQRYEVEVISQPWIDRGNPRINYKKL